MKSFLLIACLLTSQLSRADQLTQQILLNSMGDNIVYSPLSLNEALAMVYSGAEQNTASEIRNSLGWGSPNETVHQFAEINDFLAQLGSSGQLQLSSANSLWLQKSFELNPDYLKMLQSFNAEQHTADFVTTPESAREQINQWVEQKTSSKIKDLIAPGVLSPLTRLVLCNAVYFKADWLHPFEKQLTYEEGFDTLNGEVKVKMMHCMTHFKYTEDQQMQYLELPYKGASTSMIVCLPKEARGLSEWLHHSTATAISKIPGIFSPNYKRVNVTLPKFKIETTHSKLVAQMEKVGIHDLFSASANLDGIAKGQGLYVDSVIQKAMVAVDEQGTEAAAATAFMIAGNAMQVDKPVEFKADHPFLFMIVARPAITNQPVILFTGIVQNPKIP